MSGVSFFREYEKKNLELILVLLVVLVLESQGLNHQLTYAKLYNNMHTKVGIAALIDLRQVDLS